MRVFYDHKKLPKNQPGNSLTIGNFDGVHLGHQKLLNTAKNHASSGKSAIMTFDPHPRSYFSTQNAPDTLTSLPRKQELIQKCEMDWMLIEPFNATLASLEPEAFVKQYVVDSFSASHVTVGEDFRFGKNRAGNSKTLMELGARHGFEVHVVPPVMVDDLKVSSSTIRESIKNGRFKQASSLLGRPFDMDGVVIKGKQRGRTLGYPTANLALNQGLTPPSGIYAVWITDLNAQTSTRLMGAMSVGKNPTFENQDKVHFEVYILDFAEDIYNHTLKVEIIERLRPEQKFDDVNQLIKQIDSDVANVRQTLEHRA